MLSVGIKFIGLLRKELLFIYRIFMENSFSLLLKGNLILSFLKRKIKIFKNLKNFNFSSNYTPPHGLGYPKSSGNMNIWMIMSPLLPTGQKTYKQD